MANALELNVTTDRPDIIKFFALDLDKNLSV